MRRLILACALICFGCTSGPTEREQSLITEVETRVQLPKGAGKLQCYRRYYTVLRGKQLEEYLGGPNRLPYRELLIGTYREPEMGEAPGVKWVASMKEVPELHDGGCLDMTVLFATGWPENKVKALCSLDFSGNMPEEIKGKPLTC
jgi:hypothetical protein